MYNGVGTCTYKSGIVYKGHFVNGLRHGHGELHYPSGQVYVGEFAEGFRDGRGTHTSPNHGTFTGSWEKGFVSGPGELVLADGKKDKRWWPSVTFREAVITVVHEYRATQLAQYDFLRSAFEKAIEHDVNRAVEAARTANDEKRKEGERQRQIERRLKARQAREGLMVHKSRLMAKYGAVSRK